jgi:hypothetical protein
LDKLPIVTKEITNTAAEANEKQIVINEISTSTKVAEITLKVVFKLVPSKTAFSKIQFDLFFNTQQISSKSIRILQGPLANNDFPIVKSVAGTDLFAISESEKNICSEIEKTIKKEQLNNRDDW